MTQPGAFKLSHYILITGYRQQLAKAIEKLGIPYSILAEKPLKVRPVGAEEIMIMPFSNIKKGMNISDLNLSKMPTHVIAGTESGVFPAAILRRLFNARRSTETLLKRCTDKMEMKKYLRHHKVPMAKFVTHRKGIKAQEIINNLGLPVVVKDRKNSGGRNVVIAKSVEELRPLLAPQRLYEQFLRAAEGSIESFVENGSISFTNVSEYHTIKLANIVPAGYAADEIERIHALNRQVIKALNIKWGLTHLEYYRYPDGVLFGEIALRPPGGYLMELMNRAYDFDSWEIFVKVELGLPLDNLPTQANHYCGIVLFHPGAGTVNSISKPNKDDYPSLVKTSIKVKAGDQIAPRQGVGEDVGYCILSANNHAELNQDMLKMCQFNPVEIIKNNQ